MTDELHAGSLTRPKSVEKALTIQYAALGIGFLKFIMSMADLKTVPNLSGKIIVLGLGGLGLLFTWLIIDSIGRGKNWARWIFTVFTILGTPFFVISMLGSLKGDQFSAAFGFIQAALQIFSIVFLFQSPSREWFKKQSQN